MAGNFLFESYWQRLPPAYHTPVAISTGIVLISSSYIWRSLRYQPKLLSPPPKDYKYTYQDADSTSSAFTLPDGRQIGYAAYGDPFGKAIITLHGILGSRLENFLFDASAKELGIHIIGIERPGMGLSSPDPRPLKERKVIDHAKEVEALAEHLNLDEYALLATSGGGPYGLACASALPSSPVKPKLKAVSIVTGLGLPDMAQPWPAWLIWLNKTLNLRWLVKWMFSRAPEWQLHLSDEERAEGMRMNFDASKAHPADLQVAMHPRQHDWKRLFLCSTREAVRQGWDGFLDDAAVLTRDPGFRIEDIDSRLPVQLWYGTADTNINPRAGQETADRLRAGGNAKVELHMEEGETHSSTQVKFQRRILQDLVRAMEE